MIHNMVFGGGGDLSGTSFVINLAASNWSNNAQTVTVTGLTEDCLVFVGPESEFVTAYSSAGIYCVSHAANSLVFTCTTVPSVDMEVHVLAVSKVEFYDLMKITTPVVTDLVKTWDGTAQGPTVTRDTNNTIATNTTQIEPGTYSMTIALSDPVNMSWDDGAVGDKTYSYTINKASSNMSVSPTSMTFNTKTAQTISVTRSGDGAISVSNTNTGVATTSVSGTTITVTPISSGSATLTVSVAATDHYTGDSKTVVITVAVEGVEYYGKATDLSADRMQLAATTVGSYALFGGGGSMKNIFSSPTPSAVVDAYNTSLTRSTPTVLSVARDSLAATTVGSYALFGGGDGGGSSAVVDAYDTSLTRSTPTVLSVDRDSLAATTVGSYALFGGGLVSNSNSSAVVDAYNTSLTRSTPTALSKSRYELAATTVGSYALFGGGDGGGSSAVVDAYDTSLTRSTPTVLSADRMKLAATTVGSYALFGGGYGNGSSVVVDAYDTSLTRSTPTVLSADSNSLAATTVGSYALFGSSAVVDAYDTSLTRSIATALSDNRYQLAATTVGSYALFGGGLVFSSSAVVDVYTYTS